MEVYPPIEPEAIDWLKSFIEYDMITFEYGSGDSTIYFRRTVKAVVSVEHDRETYETLKKQIGPNKGNFTYELIEPIDDPKPFPYSHESFGSTVPAYLYKNFRDYVNYINNFADHSFDIIFINGRSRSSCIKEAVPKVRKGGIIILQNPVEYVYQDAIELFLGKYPFKLFGMKTTKTAIYEIK